MSLEFVISSVCIVLSFLTQICRYFCLRKKEKIYLAELDAKERKTEKTIKRRKE